MDLIIGSNHIFTIPVTDVNGNPLAISSLEGLSIQVIQHKRVKGVFVLIPTPDPVHQDIRVTPGTPTSFDYTLSKALSVRLKEGELSIRILFGNEDPDFLVDEEFSPIRDRILCNMV